MTAGENAEEILRNPTPVMIRFLVKPWEMTILSLAGTVLFQRNLWYYADDERSRLREWHLSEILTEAKRSPKPFFDCEAKAAA